MVINTKTSQKYIGRKYFWTKKKTKIVGESDWRTYKTSSKEVKAAIDEFGESNFIFKVLSVHRTRQETNYEEVKEQFARDVLEAKLPDGIEEYYNRNILSRYFKPRDFGTPEYYQKCENISAALKSAYASGRVVHPLEGKPHPNRGKKLPQTANGKPGGWFSITNGLVTRHVYSEEEIPDGWSRGMAPRKRPHKTKRRSQVCPYCGTQKILAYKEKRTVYCNRICQNKAHSERMKLKYDSGEHPLKERNNRVG